MTKRADLAWHLKKGYEPATVLIDPRLPIVKHMGWISSTHEGKTFNKTPEPDNYNFAVFATGPHEIEGIDLQCWYRDRLRGGWFSLSILQTPEETHLAHTWLQTNDWLAYWLYSYAAKIRQPMSLIDRQTYRKNSKPEPCLDELLFHQGFYQGLVVKGMDEMRLQRLAGMPRDYINYEPDL